MHDLITKIEETPMQIYAGDAKIHSLEEFTKHHNDAYFLVSHGPVKKDDPMETQRLAFATQAGNISDFARGEHVDGSGVYEIPWHNLDWNNYMNRRLWVGRASNCGIQIVHKNISKLHGSFKYQGGQVIYSDADSTNGTRIDKRLRPHIDVVVAKGAMINFGGVKFNLYSSKGFYGIVSRIE